METVFYSRMDSPLGPVLVAASAAGLRRIAFEHGEPPPRPEPEWLPLTEEGPATPGADGGGAGDVARTVREAALTLREATRQLHAYFAGTLRGFELRLDPGGSAFQRRVWDALGTIPYGATWSYGELVRRLGHPTAARAVGAANGRNPLPVVVPCHRVIGADGRLTGYAGGLHLKAFLLDLERRGSESQPCLL